MPMLVAEVETASGNFATVEVPYLWDMMSNTRVMAASYIRCAESLYFFAVHMRPSVIPEDNA